MKMNILIVTLGCLSIWLIVQCVNMGTGTQTGNPNVTAMLYNPDGSPAAQAKVCFYRHGDDPRNSHVVDSTYTDNNGNYKKDLDTGTYNILATLDANATFQDSIVVAEHDTARPPADTLRSLGSISGKIELQGADDPRTVFILFLGSNTFTRPTDLLGNFTATNMAKGRYQVTLLTTLDNYEVMDTSFVITAGRDSVIPQPIVMKYTGIPVPKGLRIEYDTMKQIVTLCWNTPTTGRPISSYNVYRRNVDSNTVLAQINTSPVMDTNFTDSTGVQDMTYEYQVAVVDTSASEGVKSAAVQVTVVSAFQFIKNFGTAGSGTGQSIGLADIAVDAQGNYWTVDYNQNKVMRFDSTGSFISEWVATGFTIGLHDPVGMDIDSQKNIYLSGWNGSSVQKYDSSGNLLLRIDSSGILIFDVSVDENGYIYFSFANSGGTANYISKYYPDGTFNKSWPVAANSLSNALLVRKDRVYCGAAKDTDPKNIIEIFDTAGVPINIISARKPGETGAMDMRDIDIDAKGLLYAVDPENGKIRVLDETSGYITAFGVKGNATEQFSSIRGVAIGKNKAIAITDMTKVHVFALP
jgi:hypothetical protein